MNELFLVAGATGYVGRHLVAELHRRGHRVRALVRDRGRAEQPGSHGAPALDGLVDEWFEAHATRPETLAGVCEGVTRVVSALGVTRQPASPWDVDFLGNLRILERAEAAAVEAFCYVNVLNVESGTSLLLRSKRAFVEALRRSSVDSQIVNPSGYFSDLEGILTMAQRGIIPQIGGGENRLNPIHGADVAAFCVDRATDPAGEWNVGGPDVFSWREISELAFRVVGRPARIARIPGPAVRGSVWAADRLGARTSSLVRFFVEGFGVDAVGEPIGTHHLDQHFSSVHARR